MNPGYPNYEADGKQSNETKLSCLLPAAHYKLIYKMLRVQRRKHQDGTYVIYNNVPNLSRGVQLMKGTSDDMFWTSEVVKRCLQLAAVVSTAISYFTGNIYQGKNFSNSWHEHSLNL